MRIFVFSVLFLAAAFAFDAFSTAHAAAWCAQYSNGGTNCYFTSQGQCQGSISGIGGRCYPDPTSGPVERARPSERSRAEPKRDTEKKPAPATSRKSVPEREAAEPPKPPAPAPVVEQPPQVQAPQRPLQTTSSFGAARALILSGKYEAGIAAMLALGHDDHPAVAVSIGFASSKLGRLDDAKRWYEKALSADPNHLSTLGSYGLLRVQQGDVPNARADLEKIKTLCGGTGCREYRELADAIAAKAR
jgi:tetratricopeptide (TPR) repeat protein